MKETTAKTGSPSMTQIMKDIADLYQGKPAVQAMNGLSTEQLEAVYGLAYNLYNSGKYDDAIDLFQWLSINNPFQPKYWMGLGASLQLKKNYCPAIYAYTTAASIKPGDPTPYLHAGECSIGMGRKDEAAKLLKTALTTGLNDPACERIHSRAQALLAAVGGDEKK